MKKIFKYTLPIIDKQEITLYAGSTILSVENQYETIVLYALVNDCVRGIEGYTILIHGTGHNANDIEGCNFVGTVKLQGGALMLHVFARRDF